MMNKKTYKPNKQISGYTGLGIFYRYKTRQQIIPANPEKGTNRRVIIHYDDMLIKKRK